MASFVLFVLGIFVFPKMLKLNGTLKPYIDPFAILASIVCIGYGIYLLF